MLTGLATLAATAWLVDAHACAPLLRLPLLGRLCPDGAAAIATALDAQGWIAALPLMAGVAAFAALAWRAR